jgi:GNAT superfamily N-acetyltransferase
MTVRPAVAMDVPEIVEMATRFVDTTAYRDAVTINRERVTALAHQLIDSDTGTIFVAQASAGDLIGMIVLTSFDHPFSGDKVVAELAWWVEPAMRGRVGLYLLRKAEQWAIEQKAQWLTMGAPTPDVERFYAATGFTPVERAYQRRM